MTGSDGSAQADLQAALAHHQSGRLPDAEALYRQVLARAPGQPDALHFLGLLRHQTGDHAAAVELIGRALGSIPRHAPCHLHLGLALQALGQPDAALASYRRASALDPALACLDRALALKPEFPEALNNRGNALQAACRFAEAIAAYDRALAVRPGYAEAHNNRGQAEEALGRTAAALAGYRQAQALQPGFAAAHFNEALALLRQGDFTNGWRLYDWRWQAVGRRALVRDYAEPRWDGNAPLAGRTLFLHYEQGFGDTLQMLRYAPLLAARGTRVLVEVPPSMAALAATLPGSVTVVTEGSAPPPFDLQCPLMSLPHACGTTLATVPADVPYLSAPDRDLQAWRERLGPARRRRIGLAWSGSAGQSGPMRARSLPLPLLLEGLGADAEYHSLQKDYRNGDRELLAADSRIRDHAAALTDFAATAGLIAHLDLVITVDTAVAHLAGAMGRPVWVLLSFAADYRWLVDRADSPWYPTMRLFRQRAFGAWAGVLSAVRTALAA